MRFSLERRNGLLVIWILFYTTSASEATSWHKHETGEPMSEECGVPLEILCDTWR